MSHVIALVDDDRNILTSVSIALQAEGFLTRVYTDGQAALKALATTPAAQWPQVLICDLSLGDTDGYEVVARIRAMEAERGAALAHRLPAIALSGHASPEYRLRSLLAGFQVHLAKPVDPNELLATVGALLPAPDVATDVAPGAAPGAAPAPKPDAGA